MNREELENLGYEESGEMSCAAHGGDHNAIIFVYPDTRDTQIYCPVEDITDGK